MNNTPNDKATKLRLNAFPIETNQNWLVQICLLEGSAWYWNWSRTCDIAINRLSADSKRASWLSWEAYCLTGSDLLHSYMDTDWTANTYLPVLQTLNKPVFLIEGKLLFCHSCRK
jgi:hypothetical protein